MKLFLDTEFIERGPKYPVQLISIGIVAEHGETLYLVSNEFRDKDCNDWVRENVLPHLGSYPRHSLADIADGVRDWVERVCRDEKPEFWGYYADYDWVVTAQLFGTMMDLPDGWPMYCRDLKQLCDSLGNPKLPEQSGTEHNALHDAMWNKQAYESLAHLSKLREVPEGLPERPRWADDIVTLGQAGTFAIDMADYCDSIESIATSALAEARREKADKEGFEFMYNLAQEQIARLESELRTLREGK